MINVSPVMFCIRCMNVVVFVVLWQALPLRPARPVLEGLEDLCRDPRNVVFVVSGRGRDELEEAFGHIKVRCCTLGHIKVLYCIPLKVLYCIPVVYCIVL